MSSDRTAASSTFITAWVSADPEASTSYEPGANSGQTGEELLAALDLAVSAQPVGSALRKDLETRFSYVSEAVIHQDHLYESVGWPAWWFDMGPDQQQENVKATKDAAVSGVSSGATPALDLIGVGCGSDATGKALVDCRVKTSRREAKSSSKISSG